MDLLIITLLFIIAIETTYLTVVNTKHTLVLGENNNKPIFVDTSVLIDGRILSVANSGFINGKLCITRSVLGELQYMADQSDNEKRARARHGLDVVSELQKIDGLKIEIFQDNNDVSEGVDNRLIFLAKKYHGAICTIDYNLNKVAIAIGVPVLNVNDLAMSLRMLYLPGEKMIIKLTDKGQDSKQAVGHLADGTMVVIEKANDKIGQTVEVEFIRGLQTAAGKMMFAKLTSSKPESVHKKYYNKTKISHDKNSKPTLLKNKSKKYYQGNKHSLEHDVVNLANNRFNNK